jgi:pimeloyl-ACP methyl ester carboxylesterase
MSIVDWEIARRYSPEFVRAAQVPKDIPDGFVSTITPCLGQEVHALESTSAHADVPVFQQQNALSLPMVMVHGAVATRRYLMPTAKLLAKYGRVFVPEMPGHGASSRPHHALCVETEAEILYHWLRLNGLKKAHIFANSYGCQVATQLVVQHPEVVDKLILTGPTCDPRARSYVKQAFRLYVDGFSEPKGGKSQLMDDLHDMSLKIAYETVGCMINDDIRTRLSDVQCPTLVVRGGKDTLSPRDWAMEVARRIPTAKYAEIPFGPHCVNYATPIELTEMIISFIKHPQV